MNNTPTIKRGESHRQAVRILQQALISLGMPLPKSTKKYNSPDGEFGDETDAAVRAFQAKHFPGVSPDGKVGQNTLNKLDDLLPGAAPPLPPLEEFEFIEDQARKMILSVLDDAYVPYVRFRYLNQIIGFGSFTAVAALIRNDRVHIRYDPVVGDMGRAVYNPINSSNHAPNTIVVPRVQIVTWKQRSLLVHECIHVAQDQDGTQLSRVHSECAAYIGQCLYVRAATGTRVTDSSPLADAIYRNADVIAAKYLTSMSPTVSAAEMGALETAILNAGYDSGMVAFDGIA